MDASNIFVFDLIGRGVLVVRLIFEDQGLEPFQNQEGPALLGAAFDLVGARGVELDLILQHLDHHQCLVSVLKTFQDRRRYFAAVKTSYQRHRVVKMDQRIVRVMRVELERVGVVAGVSVVGD